MHWKSAVWCEQSLCSVGKIVHKTRSSLEAATFNMLVCLRSWLSVDF